MMHGMTGDASMMRPFAEKILPEGWTLIVPEARYNHPMRGLTWWRYEDYDIDATRRLNLSRRELIDVDSSLSQLEKIISEQASLGPLVVGGFSQGGAMAQELMHLPIADRIVGIICIGTRLVRPMELRMRLQELDPKRMFWMHGEKDVRVPIEDGWSVAHLFEAGGWSVELIEHKKISQLPQVSYISLYHLGNQKLEDVKFGYDNSKKMFMFPGCDFGGLTNYRQKLGETCKLSKSGIKVSKDSSVHYILDKVYQLWKKRSQKERFYGQIKQKLQLFLSSVIQYLNSQSQFQNAIIKSWKLPSVHRIIYTSEDISKSMGKYYVRVFGKDDQHYAKKILPHKDVYCSVWKPEWETEIRITPNVNKNNLLNEYQTY